MKSIDTQAYLGQLTVLLEAGKTVNLVVSGSSMEPFLIHQRDAVLLEKPDRPYRKGDIVLFRRCGGKYVLHRICKLTAQGAYLIGDGQTEVEGPVAISQMIAVVTQVRRKEHVIGPGDFRWKFFCASVDPYDPAAAAISAYLFGSSQIASEGMTCSRNKRTILPIPWKS